MSGRFYHTVELFYGQCELGLDVWVYLGTLLFSWVSPYKITSFLMKVFAFFHEQISLVCQCVCSVLTHFQIVNV